LLEMRTEQRLRIGACEHALAQRQYKQALLARGSALKQRRDVGPRSKKLLDGAVDVLGALGW
jgi:hypothetical protein